MSQRSGPFRFSQRPAGAAIVALCAWFVIAGVTVHAVATDEPVAGWQQRLARIESTLRRLPAGDGVARERVTRNLAQLRQDVTTWMASFPRAQEQEQPWLEAAGTTTSVEELAAEIGRLRAAFSRIAAAIEQADHPGTFYLGRVEVAVSAKATTTATTEMTPAGATVLDARDLQANDRTTLSGALALAPGVTFVRVGQRNDTAVYVRGFDTRQVSLLIDGIPIYTPYDGSVDLERFTTFDMAELRISKGFASVLSGPNALGGAINIVSRRPAGRFEGVAGAGYGSGSSRNVYLSAGSRLQDWYVQGGASYLAGDTFPLAAGFPAVTAQPSGDRVNAHRRDAKYNVKVGWTPNGSDEYAISYVGQRGTKGNPPYAGSDSSVKVRYWQWPYWNKDSVYMVSNTHLGSSSYIRGRAFYDTYDNALYSYDDATYTSQAKSSSFKSLYQDHTIGASVEWGTTLGRQTVRAAGHLKYDSHRDHNTGEPFKEFKGRTVSVSIEDTLALLPTLSLVGGISGDWQSTTRAQDYQKSQVIDLLEACQTSSASCGGARGVNPQVGAFYSVPTGLVRFTLSRKTRLPTMKDRYSYKLGAAVPNPDLKAEHNVTIEAGYQGTLGPKTSFQASIFYSRIDDLIQRFYVQPNLYQQRNIGLASHAGFELDARTQIVPRLDVGASYTFLKRKNLSDPVTPLVDTPRHKGRVSMTGTITPFLRVAGSVDFEAGRRTQNDAGRYLDVPSYTVASVKGVWTIHRRFDAELTLLNAFDTYYWMADGYPETGRTMMATVRCRF